jgi:hypothetical protein
VPAPLAVPVSTILGYIRRYLDADDQHPIEISNGLNVQSGCLGTWHYWLGTRETPNTQGSKLLWPDLFTLAHLGVFDVYFAFLVENDSECANDSGHSHNSRAWKHLCNRLLYLEEIHMCVKGWSGCEVAQHHSWTHNRCRGNWNRALLDYFLTINALEVARKTMKLVLYLISCLLCYPIHQLGLRTSTFTPHCSKYSL